MLPALNVLGNFHFRGWLFRPESGRVSDHVTDQSGVRRGPRKRVQALCCGREFARVCSAICIKGCLRDWILPCGSWLSGVMWLLLLPWAGEGRDGRSVFSLGYVWNFLFSPTGVEFKKNLQNKNFMLEWKIHKYILGLVTDFFSLLGYKVSRAKHLFIRHGKKMLLWLQILNGCRHGACVHAVIESQHNNMPAWENGNMQQGKQLLRETRKNNEKPRLW